MIIGESHYNSSNRGQDLEERECIQWFIDGVGVNGPDNPQPLIRNIERAFYGDKPTSDQKKEFWNSVAYHLLVQRPLENINDRPNDNDFINAWGSFFKVVEILKPDYCLFCGVEAASFNGSFIEAAKKMNFEAKNIAHGKKVGNVAVRSTSIINPDGHQSELIFIRHPSSYFKREEWTGILREQMPAFIETLQ